jgi:hypothetical protein
MNEKNTHNSIIESVTAKIASGEVRAHPHTLFVGKAIVFVILGVGVLITSAFIINFILFSIHLNSHEMLLQFGPRGWSAFLRFFPWGLLLIDIVCMIFLSMLVKQFRFGYRTPLLYILGGAVVLVVMSGFFIEQHTPANRFFMGEGKGMHSGMMRGMRTPPQIEEGVCRCEIVSVRSDEEFVLRDTLTGKEFVGISSPSAYGTTSALVVGDMVFIAGELEDDIFIIFGIRKIGERGLMRMYAPRGGG